jgi:tetratricopeptide (TPR) repeat protein
MDKIITLFLAANPKSSKRSDLDVEFREINSKIRAADYHDSIDIIPSWAVRSDDLIQLLNQHRPHIVHFSGYGSVSGEIILTDDKRASKPLSNKAIKALLSTLKDNIRVVFLNACYSRQLAEAITEVVDCAIGTNRAIEYKAAIYFAASFYRAIGFGHSVQKAFEQGTASLLLEGFPEKNMPEILAKKETDPNKIFLLSDSIKENLKKDNYVDRQSITLVFVNAGDKETQKIIELYAGKKGIDKKTLFELNANPVLEKDALQIAEITAAEKEAASKGVKPNPEAAYNLGMLSAFNRDYEAALDYFRSAIESDEEYAKAFEAIAWLQQSRANHDLSNGNYEGAMQKLNEARDAANKTDPLDANALALRGYIYKTIAQIYEAKGNQVEKDKSYQKAAQLFEDIVKRDPQNASGYNGLANIQYARGNVDGAIAASEKAIELAPNYAAAHWDLALAYEIKIGVESAKANEWCKKALSTWSKAYELAGNDPGFSQDDLNTISQRIELLKKKCR